MRFLGIGDCNDLASMYGGLASQGHEVKVFIGEPDYQNVYRGILEMTANWRQELAWLAAAKEEGVVIFETADSGAQQDELRRAGFQVIGGSALGDRLEADREFGQQALRSIGMRTAKSQSFRSYEDATAFLKCQPGRYVLKFNGANMPRTRNYIGQLEDGSDVLALMAMYLHQAPTTDPPDFLLMQYMPGIEVGIGAYFNGTQFLEGVCVDFEHKRFFQGDLGELTGEMGTVVSYRGAEKLFQATLAPMRDVLAQSGYCGYVNVNLIVNEQGIWPLEFTSRFGYPGFAICQTLHTEPWDVLLRRMVKKDSLALPTKDGFAVGVVLTVPPFPYSLGYDDLSKGLPICFRPGMTQADRAALHFSEVEQMGQQLVTSGATGYVGVATGWGHSIHEAVVDAYRIASFVVVPNLRYRLDIGHRVAAHDWQALRALGWLGDDAPVI